MKKWLLFFFTLNMVSCASENVEQQGLSQNKLVKQYFNKYQRGDLEKVLTFFEEEICTQQKLTLEPVMDCYTAYLNDLSKAEGFGKLPLHISLERQQ